MVRAGDLGVDRGVKDAIPKPVRNHKIVDPPTGVVFSCLKAIAPPAVHPGGSGVLVAEGVGKAGFQQSGEAGALFVGKTGTAPVGGGVFQIDLLVCHIQIPAEDHRLAFIQLADISKEGFLPFQSMVKPGQLLLGIGGISGDQIKTRVFQGDEPAFGIQLRDI